MRSLIPQKPLPRWIVFGLIFGVGVGLIDVIVDYFAHQGTYGAGKMGMEWAIAMIPVEVGIYAIAGAGAGAMLGVVCGAIGAARHSLWIKSDSQQT